MPSNHTGSPTNNHITILLPREGSSSTVALLEFGIPVLHSETGDCLCLVTENHESRSYQKRSDHKCFTETQELGRRPQTGITGSSARFSDIPDSPEDYAGLPDKMAAFIRADRERKRRARDDVLCVDNVATTHWDEGFPNITVRPPGDDEAAESRDTKLTYTEIVVGKGISQTKLYRVLPKTNWYVYPSCSLALINSYFQCIHFGTYSR